MGVRVQGWSHPLLAVGCLLSQRRWACTLPSQVCSLTHLAERVPALCLQCALPCSSLHQVAVCPRPHRSRSVRAPGVCSSTHPHSPVLCGVSHLCISAHLPCVRGWWVQRGARDFSVNTLAIFAIFVSVWATYVARGACLRLLPVVSQRDNMTYRCFSLGAQVHVGVLEAQDALLCQGVGHD